MSTKQLICPVLVLFFSASFSQVVLEKRVEYPLKEEFEFEDIFAMDSLGALLVQKSQKSEEGLIEWRFSFLDTGLNEVKAESIFMSKKSELATKILLTGRFSAILVDNKGNFNLLDGFFPQYELIVTKGEIPSKMEIEEISALGEYVFIYGEVKGNPLLFSVNIRNQQKISVPLGLGQFKKKNVNVLGFQTFKEDNEALLFTVVKEDNKESNTYVTQFNSSGENSSTRNITENLDQNIVNITGSNQPDVSRLFVGTYSSKKVESSEGIFFAKSRDGNIEFFTTKNFLELDNFLSYLPEKKQERMEKKKEKKESKGKDLKINYLLASHDLIDVEDGLILVGEAYYPTQRMVTTTRTTYGPYGPTTNTQTTTVFDGYQYTHAFVSKFDFNGNILWDQSFELNPGYKPMVVKKFVAVSSNNSNEVGLLYTSKNKILSKLVGSNGEVLKEKESSEIETDSESDKIKKRASTQVDYWYKNYFLVFGEQKIVSKEENQSDKRKVFFMNKISFQ